jgi:hypothetical protein
MTITVTKGSATAAAVVAAAALLLTGCGFSAETSGDSVAPGAQSTSGASGNPNEHRGHRDLQSVPAVVSNPNEHRSHFGH